ncbi:ATP-binding cassette domain-containing protein [Endozoicomonas euniceicola]|uniref:ATP-binding cassette domain-containing protein n=1 Tax=Endozoicomonas euniceicola TaxID=1234143 RepID=A0ABY6GYZ4_9GAMM|nr:ATP-binding cassette domain-containing protein [Endozoicomonas euniceicola]UYM18006.1 ATP-binding cassette domain-containing protein [Endozoicomonas euniceicola]
MITLNSVSLQRSGKVLLEDTSATIHHGQHVGLVGANGCGKSSLLALLMGELQPDQGDVSIDPGRGIAHMAQEIKALERKAVEYVLDGDEQLRAIEQKINDAENAGQHEKLAELHEQLLLADGYTARSRAEQMLHGLGFGNDQIENSVKDFSGGWRMRLNLARTLMSPSDVLFLDEPTNHLDLDAIVWLEGFLQRYQGTLVVISHDRDFLDAVTDITIHIEHQKANTYRGNYSAFERMRAERLQQQQAAFERQQKQREHMEKFVERFRAKATKAKQAQSRLKALARLEDIVPAHVDSPFTFRFPEPDKMSSPLLSIDQGELGYGDKALLKLKLSVLPGSRIGLLGANGAGKSTLIRTLAQELPLIAGKRQDGEHLKVGYFAQHQLESLDPHASPALHLQRISPDAREQELRNFLGGFGFHGDKATETIEGFSGGEQARLALAIVAWQKPNLLLLDEPTNHLDLEMRHALTMALQEFEGAMILVSHDRNLLRSTTDELLLVHDGRVDVFAGDLDDYSDWLTKLRTQATEQQNEDYEEVAAHSARGRKDQKRLAAERRNAMRPLKKQADKLESQLDKLQTRLAVVEDELADSSIYDATEKDRLKNLLAEQTDLTRGINNTEEEWMMALEELEALEQELSQDRA